MDDLANVPPEADTQSSATGEPRVPFRLYALKDGDTFMVADAYGDVLGVADGLFRNDTRLLSYFRLKLAGRSPSLLSAAVSQDNVFFTSNTTNLPLAPTGAAAGAPHGVIHVERKRFLWDERLYERVRLTNYDEAPVQVPVRIEFDADFHDMFEVRGEVRRRRGRTMTPDMGESSVGFRYEGLDGVMRCSCISFSETPERLTPHSAEFTFQLQPDCCKEIYLEVGPRLEDAPCRGRFRGAAARSRALMHAKRRHGGRLRTSGRLFDEWVEKSRSDLSLLVTDMKTGPYPYAGIPWFSTAFGRDAIITAWQVLWINAALAKGVLGFLASHQATEVSRFRDAQPGKIMHETRKGEMTSLAELPFGQYYGGVDTTPLFVALAGAYADRTGDLAFIDELWPSLLAAVRWIEDYGDSNGDGLIDYQRGAETGLANQGWKDSVDSVFHADGRFPDGPIALVEVQGYAFMAFRAMASLAERRGEGGLAQAWRGRAEDLRQKVEEQFWMEDVGTYGIAVDGHGELCRVRTSNPGHLLFSALPAADRAKRVVQELLSQRYMSGWGVRTLAVGEARYNPMSYHDGSVWPHDTAVCAAGMARYGERDGVVKILAQVFETAVHFEMRLPELYCGFQRKPGEPPVAYPVACLPQAWAAGSIFMLLQAVLGIRIDGWTQEITVEHPRLPIGIESLRLEGVEIGGQKVDLGFQQAGGRVIAVPGRTFDPSVALVTRS